MPDPLRKKLLRHTDSAGMQQPSLTAGPAHESDSELDKLIARLDKALDLHQLLDVFITHVRRTVPCDGIEYEEDSANLYLLDGDLMDCACHYNLSCQGQSLGKICFTRSFEFTEDERVVLETMLSGLVLPLRNALRYQQAIRVAQRDELTGLRNSSYYHDNVQLEIERARRYRIPFSLILLDVDNFKQINDEYGREVGDAVLMQLAGRLEAHARSSDIVFRNGGDAFLIFLPHTQREQAVQVAERIRRLVSATCCDVEQQHIAVTISAGVVTVSVDDNASKLNSRADKALFHAKILGKNRVHAETAPENLQRGWST